MSNIKNWEEFIKDIPTDVLVYELERRKEEVKNKINANPISHDIMEEIDDALIQFGHYTFSDKGPWEVMDISTLVQKLKTKTAKEVGEILSQVLDNYEKFSSSGEYKHAEYVVNAIVGEFDSMSEEWFDELLDSDERFEY
jgi:flagellar motor switch protein FliG